MSESLANALAEAVQRLERAGVAAATGDARKLLAFALKIDPGLLASRLDQPLTPAQQVAFNAAITQRQARQPVAQIIGSRAFYNGVFMVTPDVLDPRPETELLVSEALKAPFTRLLDLGTGSGCIAVSLLMERPGARALATDISPAALLVAAENARRHNVAARFVARLSDWFSAIQGRFELIVSNPPYISAADMAGLAPDVREHEPRIALTPGADGLAAYRIIIAAAGSHLTPGGRLMVEIGATQGRAVAELFRAAGLCDVGILPDLNGHDRVVSGRSPQIPV